MYLSLNWLKDHVNLGNIDAGELGARLTLRTVEVEHVENQNDKFDKVVIGKILEIAKHPKADRLQLAVVDIGSAKLHIVCGAPNIAVGQLVPVATIGAVLPGNFEIKPAEIRGERSEGMLCAEDELGLGTSHEGIMVLKKAKVGQKFSDYLGLDDTIIEVDNKSLSNRPDLWGHYGIARELSVIYDAKLKPLDADKISLDSKAALEPLTVKIEAKELCQRYLALRVKNVPVKESPQWLQQRLSAVGLRPINSLVDITNYVMLDLGQPLHAFDARNLTGVTVRKARKNETITTLDGQERKLDPEMLLIADNNRALALAGIMGGQDSGVQTDTDSIILEAATFDPVSIRKTSSKLGLRTDASIRFEKSLDPELAETAIKMAWKLIKKIYPKAEIASTLTEERTQLLAPLVMPLSLDYVNSLIGIEIEPAKIEKLLSGLGFKIQKISAGSWEISVPSWRATKDISIPADLVEEILRLYGYENLAGTLPSITMNVPLADPERELEKKIKQTLSGNSAMAETYNYSFVGADQLARIGLGSNNYLRLANPIADTQALLRQNLTVGLIANVRLNQFKHERIALFEIGSIYLNVDGSINKNNEKNSVLPHQEKHLGLAWSDDQPDLLRRAKGDIENLLEEIFGPEAKTLFLSAELPLGWAGKQRLANISVGGKNIGIIGQVDEEIIRNSGLKKATVIAEISLKELNFVLSGTATRRYQPLSKYPVANRDLAFVVDNNILYHDLYQEISNFHPLISAVELFDIYSGANLGFNKKSLAFHITYQSPERTLTTEEVDAIQTGLTKAIEEKFEAQVRNF